MWYSMNNSEQKKMFKLPKRKKLCSIQLKEFTNIIYGNNE